MASNDLKQKFFVIPKSLDREIAGRKWNRCTHTYICVINKEILFGKTVNDLKLKWIIFAYHEKETIKILLTLIVKINYYGNLNCITGPMAGMFGY